MTETAASQPSEDWEVLELFAAHAAAALERLRFSRAERTRAWQAEQLSATLAEVGAASELNTAVEALLRGAVTLLDADEAVTQIYEPETGQFVPLADTALGGGLRDERRLAETC